MTEQQMAGGMALAVVVPASNEAALIGRCLEALAHSDWQRPDGVQVIVVANGCHDATAEVARGLGAAFAARGWVLEVIDRAEGSKPAALNAGDAAVRAPVRVYLDADVQVSPPLLAQLAGALAVEGPRYASGTLAITAQGAFSRAYARYWRRVPFMSRGVPGCGLYAVNAAGRQRWQAFPPIIADDILVRLSFTPSERFAVAAPYRWPIAEGLAALVKVRRRQDAGVREVADRFPQLMRNEDKPRFPLTEKLALAARDPLAFAAYALVAALARLTRRRAQDWSRGR